MSCNNCLNNLIVNGDFEQVLTEGTFQYGGGAVSGWNQYGIDVLGRYQVHSGVDINRFIDLNGSPGEGFIEQLFPTTIGQNYSVKFKLQGDWLIDRSNPRTGYVCAANHRMNFSVDPSSYSLPSWPPETEEEMGWVDKEFIFTAISTGTTIKFATTTYTNNNYAGPIIDCICVTETSSDITQPYTPCLPTNSPIDTCNDYTRFNNITSLNDHQLVNHLEENIKTFLDWGFLNIGGFVNVKIPTSGLFGGNFSDLKSSDQPGYNPGQVWQSAKKEWVWETGVVYNGTSPTSVSGVYVSNTFYPAPTGSGNIGYNINYPLGQIIFNKPLASSTPVKLEYSYRWCQVLKGGANEFLTELQGGTFAPNPAINDKTKGEYQISSNHRVQMPCVIIEPIARSYSKPWQMGAHDFAVDQDILLHVFAENYQDQIKITDIIRFQKEKVIYLYDIAKVVKSGVNPLDYKGSININGKNYYDLVTNTDYRWNKCFFKEISLMDMESVNKNLYWCTLRLTAEVIL